MPIDREFGSDIFNPEGTDDLIGYEKNEREVWVPRVGSGPDLFGQAGPMGPKELLMAAMRSQRPDLKRCDFTIWGYEGEPIRDKFEIIPGVDYRMTQLYIRQHETPTILRSIMIGTKEQLGVSVPMPQFADNPPLFIPPRGKFNSVVLKHAYLQQFGRQGLSFDSGGPGVPIKFLFDGAIDCIVMGILTCSDY